MADNPNPDSTPDPTSQAEAKPTAVSASPPDSTSPPTMAEGDTSIPDSNPPPKTEPKAEQPEPEPEPPSDSSTAISLPLNSPSFDLAKTVCSHGFFMMAPNRWDPSTQSLRRPLRLCDRSTVSVRISQPSPHCVLVTVFGRSSLSQEDQQTILGQVRRMLRVSEENDSKVREFHELHAESKERGFGRLFRAPTLFEDMVKCMLLCNCQWPRTLSMARALCELQLELTKHSSADDIQPKPPRPREMKRKRGKEKKAPEKVETKSAEKESAAAVDNVSCDPENTLNASVPARESSEDVSCPSDQIGDFPTPEELSVLSKDFLANQCGLGYRAKRIVLLAQSIVDDRLPGKLPLRKLEEVCDGSASADFDEIDKQLSCISGLGPFTHSNILMCMGFYNRIPVDTETIRHLKQFHARSKCTARTVQKDLESIYRKYEPFQFLAYWSEVWGDYDKRFGEISKMPPSDYKLFTANNMKRRFRGNKS